MSEETHKSHASERLDYVMRQAYRILIALIGYFLWQAANDINTIKKDFFSFRTTIELIVPKVETNTKWIEARKAEELQELKDKVKQLESNEEKEQ